jgi:protein TonB
MGIFQDLIAYFIPKEEVHFPALPFIDLADLKILSAPNPEDFYPAFSKHAGESGVVRLLLKVDPSGQVVQVKLVKSSSFARLDQAAINLSGQFLFDARIQQGEASAFQTSVEVEFKKSI